VAENLQADIVLDEVVEAAPLVLPPDEEIALAEALHEAGETSSEPECLRPRSDVRLGPRPGAPSSHGPPAGPPEATPGFVAARQEPPAAGGPPKKLNWFQRLASGSSVRRTQLGNSLAAVFAEKKLRPADAGRARGSPSSSRISVWTSATSVTATLKRGTASTAT